MFVVAGDERWFADNQGYSALAPQARRSAIYVVALSGFISAAAFEIGNFITPTWTI
jgi:hypothetical protein